MKTRIAINGYFLTRPFTGFGVYTKGLLKALDKTPLPDNIELFVIAPQKTDIGFNQIKTIVVPEPTNVGTSFGKIWWEQFTVPKALKKHKINLIHHFYPGTAIFSRGITQITSIHDATPWHFAKHSPTLKIKLFRKFMVWSNRKADWYVTVSNYARDDVAGIYKIAKEKIDVVYNGIDQQFRRAITDAGKEAVAKKYNLPKSYIFYVGGFEVHKNVRNLLLSYAKIAPQIKQDLVIAGGVFSKSRIDVYQDYFAIPQLVNQYNIANRVHMVGVIPDEDLPAMYQLADIYVMPSLAEGFNLPLVQAFASKVPAIASQTPASEEIAGQAARLVDTSNIEALADAMQQLLADKKKQQELIMKAVERQNAFRWEDAANRLLDIYQRFI